MKMNAKEMFESIGYHQVVISPKYCSYSFDDGRYIKSIEFIGIKKEIRLHDLETYNDNKSQGVFVLDEYELKAINKQMEELGVTTMSTIETFEELGYKKNVENGKITYSQDFGSGYFEIIFYLSENEIEIETNMEVVIENDLLIAINQQCKELGWL